MRLAYLALTLSRGKEGRSRSQSDCVITGLAWDLDDTRVAHWLWETTQDFRKPMRAHHRQVARSSGGAWTQSEPSDFGV